MGKKAKVKNKKKNRKKKLKITLLVVEIIIILFMILAAVMIFVPNSKIKALKAITSCAPGRTLISCVLGSDYEKYLQDKDFNSENINQNKNLKMSGKYTNIALFGSDARGEDLAGKGSHTDSIIIVSMNNQTGEVKMCSVFRDTVLEFVVDDKIYYDKATNAFSYGDTETVINMLNSNLDLNIKDYAMVNFAGLANIIDALGGVDIHITEDERKQINNYLGETRAVTEMTTPNVYKAGDVHLTGLQATAYCRNRYTAFYNEDGTVVNDDYGRAARQRLILEKIVEKAKSAGASQMIKVARTLFSKNTGDDRFLVTSLSFDEILDLIPNAIKFNLAGSEGFPFAKTSNNDFRSVVVKNKKQQSLYSTGQSCVFAKGLEYNVKKLHEYLFGEEDYEPTENVKEISEILEDITGVESETESVSSSSTKAGTE